MGFIGFLASLVFFILVCGVAYIIIDVANQAAPDEIRGTVDSVNSGLWFLKPRFTLEHGYILLGVVVVLGMLHLLFGKHTKPAG